MPRKALIVRAGQKPRFKSRRLYRCRLCGRKRGYLRRFGLCRICFREEASRGTIPGVLKSSW